jgi:hypothetical protein
MDSNGAGYLGRRDDAANAAAETAKIILAIIILFFVNRLTLLDSPLPA